MIKIYKPTLPPYTMRPLRASYTVTLNMYFTSIRYWSRAIDIRAWLSSLAQIQNTCKPASAFGHGQWLFVHGYRHLPKSDDPVTVI